MKRSIFFLAALLFATSAFCQEVYHFTKALEIYASFRYGREALYTDPFLYQLYSNTLKQPVESDSLQVGARNQFVKWVTVTSDSSHWFKGRGGFGGGGGYAYLAYNSEKEQPALLNIKGNSAVVVNGVLHAGEDRGVILYGNKTTNAAWKLLLTDCPIQVERNRITAGSKTWQGGDFSAYFIWPLHNSTIASVAVISGTGINGMQAANANQYFAGASGFPDFMIYRKDMLLNGSSEIKMAGFFDNDWKLSAQDSVQND